jgi:hypothetical protein
MSSLQGWANTQADGKSGGFGVAYQGDTANRMIDQKTLSVIIT